MIDLYYWTTPNGHKITMFLEEAKMKYRVIPVNIGKGEQFDPAFLKIAPNNRIPAMVDHKPMQVTPDGEPLAIFESGAMLLYLADKSKKFLNRKSLYWLHRWPARPALCSYLSRFDTRGSSRAAP